MKGLEWGLRGVEEADSNVYMVDGQLFFWHGRYRRVPV